MKSKKKQNSKKMQQRLLLGMLLLFSMSIHVVCGKKSAGKKIDPFSGMSAQQFVAHEGFLIESASVEALVVQLQRTSLDKGYDVIHYIFDHLGTMNEQDIMEVACGIGLYHAKHGVQKDSLYVFFDKILKLGSDTQRPPLLFIAAQSNYPTVLPILFGWTKERKNQEAVRALQHAVKYLNISTFTTFAKQNFVFSPQLATQLLWQVVSLSVDSDEQEPQRAAIVAFLLDKKANPNYEEAGYSVLMHAALSNNAVVVRQLVKAGARINTIIKNEVGSALQLAIRDKNLEAELALRDLGAVE